MDPQTRTNLGVLYATLIIIFGTIATEWPPGEVNLVLVAIGIFTAGIAVRIVLLIWKIDPLIPMPDSISSRL